VPHVGEHDTLGKTIRKQLRHTELLGPIVVGARVTGVGVAGASVVVTVGVAVVVVVVVVLVVMVKAVAVHGIKWYVIFRSIFLVSHTVAGSSQVDGLPLIRLVLARI